MSHMVVAETETVGKLWTVGKLGAVGTVGQVDIKEVTSLEKV